MRLQLPESINEEDSAALLSAAEQGDADAQFRLGVLLFDQGESQEGIAWLRKAVAQEHPGAFCRLGILYLSGESDVRFDAKYGVHLLKKAAACDDANALFHLGMCYEQGLGIKRSRSKAVACYTRSADLGSSGGLYMLALCYMDGSGVRRDIARANELLQEAARLGHLSAYYDLAINYYTGNGIDKNISKAISLMERSADGGDEDAMLFLACAYLDGGYGVPQNSDAARTWLIRALDADPELADSRERFEQIYHDQALPDLSSAELDIHFIRCYSSRILP